MLAKLCSRFAAQRGLIALEALICIPFLFATIFTFWGVGVTIYNQSKLQNAAQHAAQAALIYYNRHTYRNDDSQMIADARAGARTMADTVLRENARGMIGDQMGRQTIASPQRISADIFGNVPNPLGDEVVTCAGNVNGVFTGMAVCGTPGMDTLVEQAYVRARVQGAYYLVSMLTVGKYNPWMYADGVAYSITAAGAR
jgi:Flp pilus assembly protein TadG